MVTSLSDTYLDERAFVAQALFGLAQRDGQLGQVRAAATICAKPRALKGSGFLREGSI